MSFDISMYTGLKQRVLPHFLESNTNNDVFFTLESFMNLLQRLEWSGKYSYCTGWPCCPLKGIKPRYGRDYDTGSFR